MGKREKNPVPVYESTQTSEFIVTTSTQSTEPNAISNEPFSFLLTPLLTLSLCPTRSNTFDSFRWAAVKRLHRLQCMKTSSWMHFAGASSAPKNWKSCDFSTVCVRCRWAIHFSNELTLTPHQCCCRWINCDVNWFRFRIFFLSPLYDVWNRMTIIFNSVANARMPICMGVWVDLYTRITIRCSNNTNKEGNIKKNNTCANERNLRSCMRYSSEHIE